MLAKVIQPFSAARAATKDASWTARSSSGLKPVCHFALWGMLKPSSSLGRTATSQESADRGAESVAKAIAISATCLDLRPANKHFLSRPLRTA